jgi:hypothetical protein
MLPWRLVVHFRTANPHIGRGLYPDPDLRTLEFNHLDPDVVVNQYTLPHFSGQNQHIRASRHNSIDNHPKRFAGLLQPSNAVGNFVAIAMQ